MGGGQKYVCFGRQETKSIADPSSRAVQGARLLGLGLGLGFRSRREYGYLTLVSAVLSGRSLRLGLIIRPENLYLMCCV